MNKNYKLVTKVSDLDGIGRNQVVVLAGQSIIAGLDMNEPGYGFAKQPFRPVRRGLPIPAPKEGISVWIDENILKGLKSNGGRVQLALDSFLQWGLKHGQVASVICGGFGPQTSGTLVDTIEIEDGEIKKIVQNTLPPRSLPSYKAEFDNLVRREKTRVGENGEVAVYEGLDPDDSQMGVLKIPLDVPFRFTLSAIDFGYARFRVMDFVMAGAVCASVIAGSLLYVNEAYKRYEGAVAQFDSEVAEVAEVYAGGESTLRGLESKKTFLETPRPYIKQVEVIERLMKAVAMKDRMKIDRINLIAKSPEAVAQFASLRPGETAPDFVIQISVVPDEKLTPLEQSADVVRYLSNATFSDISMVGVSEAEITSGKGETVRARTLSLEGRLKSTEDTPS